MLDCIHSRVGKIKGKEESSKYHSEPSGQVLKWISIMTACFCSCWLWMCRSASKVWIRMCVLMGWQEETALMKRLQVYLLIKIDRYAQHLHNHHCLTYQLVTLVLFRIDKVTVKCQILIRISKAYHHRTLHLGLRWFQLHLSDQTLDGLCGRLEFDKQPLRLCSCSKYTLNELVMAFW